MLLIFRGDGQHREVTEFDNNDTSILLRPSNLYLCNLLDYAWWNVFHIAHNQCYLFLIALHRVRGRSRNNCHTGRLCNRHADCCMKCRQNMNIYIVHTITTITTIKNFNSCEIACLCHSTQGSSSPFTMGNVRPPLRINAGRAFLPSQLSAFQKKSGELGFKYLQSCMHWRRHHLLVGM